MSLLRSEVTVLRARRLKRRILRSWLREVQLGQEERRKLLQRTEVVEGLRRTEVVEGMMERMRSESLTG